jgi:hypothetical protein
MKINYYLFLSIVLVCSLMASCSLDYHPVDSYSDITEGVDTAEVIPIFRDREAVLGARTTMFTRLGSGDQEYWYQDMLLISEVRADNAYAGTTGNEVVPWEVNSIDGSNINLRRSWNMYMANVARANRIIWGADPVEGLSDAEKRQFKAEAKIFRAMIYFDMVRIWGNVPLITTLAGDITAENIEEVYPAYFPPQTEELLVYQQIEEDLLEGVQYALNNNPNDKTILTKSVARALLAKLYAEKPLRDYDKVIKYADELVADGFDLVENFSDLFGVVLQDPTQPPSLTNQAIDLRVRNTKESIFEAQWFPGNANWMAMMFGRQLHNWNSAFTWAKWITPSRDLIRLFNREPDDKRYLESVVWYSCTWTNYYPADNYAFMYKYRSGFNSIIKYRYADILLLKAEALIGKGDFAGAAEIINRTRARAGLGPLSASATANKDAIMNAYLRERRLELCFENQRWFDLVRLDKVEEVMNSLWDRDERRLPIVYPYDQFSYRLPIPKEILDQNSNLVQNPGY